MGEILTRNDHTTSAGPELCLEHSNDVGRTASLLDLEMVPKIVVLFLAPRYVDPHLQDQESYQRRV